MKVSHSMCGPHEDSDIICGPVRHLSWHNHSTPLYHKIPVALIFSHVTFTCIKSKFNNPRKIFLSRASAKFNPRPPRTRAVNPPLARL